MTQSDTNHVCSVCDCSFNAEEEGGVIGDFGILPVAFCPNCFTCMLEMADQFNTGEEIEQAVVEEREACAALCFQMWNEWMDNEFISELNRPDAEDCAHAIRKRGLDNLNKEAEKNGEEL